MSAIGARQSSRCGLAFAGCSRVSFGNRLLLRQRPPPDSYPTRLTRLDATWRDSTRFESAERETRRQIQRHRDRADLIQSRARRMGARPESDRIESGRAGSDAFEQCRVESAARYRRGRAYRALPSRAGRRSRIEASLRCCPMAGGRARRRAPIGHSGPSAAGIESARAHWPEWGPKWRAIDTPALGRCGAAARGPAQVLSSGDFADPHLIGF